MGQRVYVAKPSQVFAEQFTEGMSPDAAGVHRCGLAPGVDTGPPHVHANGQVYLLASTDWIISDRFSAAPTGVLTDAQFTAIYGPGGGAPLEAP
jgi:hypothetical protein